MSDSRDPFATARRPSLSRRGILKLTAAASLLGVPGVRALAGDTAPMHERAIPSTGEKLPVVGLGTSGAFQTVPGANLDDQRAVLRRFVALGGKLIDTSPTYGNAEQNVGKLSSDLGLRDKLFMATKVHARGKQTGIMQMQGSLQRLGHIDLMQVHNLIDVDTQLATLRQWKADGKIRYIGITHYQTHAFEALARLMQSQPLDFVQFNYSVVTPQAEQVLLPLAHKRGIAVIVNRAFEDGRWFSMVHGRKLPAWAGAAGIHSWGQFALKYVISHPTVTCVIPATRNVKHLADNMAAGTGVLPDQATRKRMREFAAGL